MAIEDLARGYSFGRGILQDIEKQKQKTQLEVLRKAVSQGNQEALDQLSLLDPRIAQNVLNQRRLQIQEQQIRQEEQQRKQNIVNNTLSAYSNMPDTATRKSFYNSAVRLLKRQGLFNDSGLPEEWNPDIDESLQQEAELLRTPKQRLEQQKLNLEKERFDLSKKGKNQVLKTDTGFMSYNPQTGGIQLITNQEGNAIRPYTRPDTVVNVNQGEKEEQKQLGKLRVQQFASLEESANKAQRGLDTLENLKKAVLNPNAAQGSFANLRSSGKKLANLFGVQIEGLTDEGIITALGNQLALQLRNPKGDDGGLTGNTSDKDLSFLIASVPNMDKTREQNLALIEMSRKDKERTIKLRNSAKAYLKEKGTLKGFNRQEFFENNPLFPDKQDYNRIKNMLQVGGYTLAPNKNNLKDDPLNLFTE